MTTHGRATIRRPPAHRPGGLLLPGMPVGRPRRRPVRQPAPAGGRWIARTHTNAAGTHAYKLYIPSKYRGQPMPLVVMLHGCSQDPDDFAAGTGMNFRAEEVGFLVAYPAKLRVPTHPSAGTGSRQHTNSGTRGSPRSLPASPAR